MKIFSKSQIQAADTYTIANEPIASIDLMERAARACYDWFNKNIDRSQSISIYCGQGNNGGDGLALARMLRAAGYNVSAHILEHSKATSHDFNENLERLNGRKIPVKIAKNAAELNEDSADVIVDALLGSGLNKPLQGFLVDAVTFLNQQKAQKISIDIPTGLFVDSNKQNNTDAIFKADTTLTFQFPKWSFLFPEFGQFAGEFHVLSIGLDLNFIDKTETNNYFIDKDFISDLLPKRNKFDHKGTFGHALIIAGSYGKIGASILSSRAALKTGAGLVSCYLPSCGVIPMQSANPEIMVIADAEEKQISHIEFDIKPTAIGIGPGLGTATSTKEALLQFLKIQKNPVVLDADALNLLAENKAWNFLPENSILTPHLGELDRILGARYRGEDMYEHARDFAIKQNIILLVKGAHTAIYQPNGNVCFNSSGTNGMATAGSGDLLTGMITGLLAQGMNPEHAAIVAVYLHGKAGQKAAQHLGNAAMIAGDIISHINIPN